MSDTNTLPRAWTPIAARPRNCLSKDHLTWKPTLDAPLGVDEAWTMAKAGKLVMACQHFVDAVVLVIRPTRKTANLPPP